MTPLNTVTDTDTVRASEPKPVPASLPASSHRQHRDLWLVSDRHGEVARHRICVVSEDLSGPLDEGAKKLTVALARALSRDHNVRMFSTRAPVTTAGVEEVSASSRTFLSRELRSAIQRDAPDVVIYASRRAATFASFLRARVLKSYSPRSRVVLLGLQTRHLPAWQHSIVRTIQPHLIAVQSPRNHRYLQSIGCRAALIPSGVDLERFHPVGHHRRVELREKYGLRPDRPVVLHVGHLQRGRGIDVLGEIAAHVDCQVVLITSTSTHQEHDVARLLESSGVMVRTDFIPAIEELYQAADCYVFPVESTDNAIEVPLSVLESLACGTPVISTRFGGLPEMFGSDQRPGLTFVGTRDELVGEVGRVVRAARPPQVEHLVEGFSWDSVARVLIRHLGELA